MRALERLWRDWRRFWFQSYSVAQWRLFRAAICSIMFVAYLIRQFSLDEFFSSRMGIFIDDPSRFVPMAYRWALFDDLLVSAAAEWLVPMLHAGYLLALGFLVLGILTRASAVVAFILHVSFIHANIGAVYGVDLIFTFFLFFFCLASDRVRDGQEGPRAWISSMAFRFGQIQLCVIYAFSGWEKLKGAAWWNGEALWAVIANPQMARFDFSWLAHFPLVLVFVAYLTLIWEIYFPVLIWLPRWRWPTLIVGVLFHLSIVGMMKLAFFGLMMISVYLLFLTPREVVSLLTVLRRIPLMSRVTRNISLSLPQEAR